MGKRSIVLVALVLVALAALTVPGHPQSPIRIGVIEPLSGPVAASGNYVRMGAEIARDWINAKGGIAGRKVDLLIEDNKSDPKEAASAAEKLIVRDKVPAIMGAWGSSMTLAAMPKLEEYGVPMVVETSSAASITKRGNPWVFRISPPSEMEALGLEKYLGALGIRQADYFGYSNGAAVALYAVIRHPEAVRKLVFMSATYRLDGIQPGENVSLIEGVKNFCLRDSGKGILVLISDLMDKEGYEKALRFLVTQQMDVYVLHVLSPEELNPEVKGDLRLIDCEDDDVAEVTVSRPLLDKYKRTLASSYQSIRASIMRYVAHNPAAWTPEFERYTRVRYAWTLGADWPRLAMVQTLINQGTRTCLPTNWSIGVPEARAVFETWVRTHPNAIDDSAGLVAAMALVQAHKCGG